MDVADVDEFQGLHFVVKACIDQQQDLQESHAISLPATHSLGHFIGRTDRHNSWSNKKL